MLIYVNMSDGQTDKHIKSIVRNLTIFPHEGSFGWGQVSKLFRPRRQAHLLRARTRLPLPLLAELVREAEAAARVAHVAEPLAVAERLVAAVAPLARLQAEDVERQELPAVRAHEAHGVEDELDSARRQVEGEAEAREAGTQDLRPGCVVPSATKVEFVLFCYFNKGVN